MGEGTGKRSFVALMLGAPLGRVLTARLGPPLERLGGAQRDALRLHGPQDLHLTLAFLGELPVERRTTLVAKLGPALAQVRAPHLLLTRPGAFPARGRERVLWAGLRDLSGQRLAQLAGRVRDCCRSCGIPLDDRPFRPHVTLARVRAAARGRVPAAFYAQDPALEWKPSAARFVISLGPGQACLFRPQESFPLAAPGRQVEGPPAS